MISVGVQNLIRQKVGKGNRFDPALIPIVAILKTVGASDKDVALYLGVKPSTISKWKKSYPAFKDACAEGKKASASHLLATAFQEATGYDYTETTYEGYADEDGEWQMREKRITTKHARANPELLKWLLIIIKNQFPEYDFQDTKKIEINERSVSMDLRGELEADRIRELARIGNDIADGIKTKKRIESKVSNAED